MKTRILPLGTVVLGALGVWFSACAAQIESSPPPGSGGGAAPMTGGNGGAPTGASGAPVVGGGAPYYAGAPPVGAAGAPPVGAAGAPPVGSAGAPPVGSAGAPPVGAAGAPPSAGCVLAVGTATDLAIDDLEDGNNAIQMLGQRAGFWYTYNDGTALQVPAPGATAFPPTAGGHSVKFSANTHGPAFTSYGAGMGFDFNNTAAKPCPYNASAYRGITFWAKGNVPIKAMLKTPGTTAAPQGACVATVASPCEDHYFLKPKPPLTATWTLYTIDFATPAAFDQEGWGGKVPFDKSALLGMQFQVDKALPFDFSIDDVTFF